MSERERERACVKRYKGNSEIERERYIERVNVRVCVCVLVFKSVLKLHYMCVCTYARMDVCACACFFCNQYSGYIVCVATKKRYYRGL